MERLSDFCEIVLFSVNNKQALKAAAPLPTPRHCSRASLPSEEHPTHSPPLCPSSEVTPGHLGWTTPQHAAGAVLSQQPAEFFFLELHPASRTQMSGQTYAKCRESGDHATQETRQMHISTNSRPARWRLCTNLTPP